jgi:hypothetical protein
MKFGGYDVSFRLSADPKGKHPRAIKSRVRTEAEAKALALRDYAKAARPAG